MTTTGVVTAAYPDGGFNGYTIQTPATGGAVNLAEHKASDGLFVYDSKNVKDLQIGDYVKVNGTISEYYGLTELNASSVTKLSDKVEAPKASTMAFPKTDTERESLESMLIAPQGDYTVSDVYNTNKYGEIGLAASNKPFLNPTVKGLKGDAETGAAYQAELDRIEAEGVYLDDGSSRNFLDTKYPDNADTPLPYLSNDQPVRVGEKVTFTKPVVLDYRNSAWRFQPTERLTGDNADAQPVTFTSTRTDTPDLPRSEAISGSPRSTCSTTSPPPPTRPAAPRATPTPTATATRSPRRTATCAAHGTRPTWNAAGEDRQGHQQPRRRRGLAGGDRELCQGRQLRAGIIQGRAPRLRARHAGRRAQRAGRRSTWAYVPSPQTVPDLDVEDVIRTAFIYKPTKSRPSAQPESSPTPTRSTARTATSTAASPTPRRQAKGAADSDAFLVVANHFKSKGSASNALNQDPGDGSGNADYTRQAQADALLASPMR